jgi:hypothetical protein
VSLNSDSHRSGPINFRRLGVHALMGILVVVVGILAYAFITRSLISPPVDPTKADGAPGKIIQLDLLNGCGIPRAASYVTAYLRARGFDVVETRNYKTFDVKESLVIDRSGNVELARKVAYALGVSQKNIIQQINPDYFVDVSVVIGRDYASLKPYQQ